MKMPTSQASNAICNVFWSHTESDIAPAISFIISPRHFIGVGEKSVRPLQESAVSFRFSRRLFRPNRKRVTGRNGCGKGCLTPKLIQLDSRYCRQLYECVTKIVCQAWCSSACPRNPIASIPKSTNRRISIEEATHVWSKQRQRPASL